MKREDSIDRKLVPPPRLDIVFDTDLKFAVLMADTSFIIMIIFRLITI